MSQQFKTIYFPATGNDNKKRRNLTVAFGAGDSALYSTVRNMTSLELRQALGHDCYESLADAAATDQRPVSSYCLNQLRQVVREPYSINYGDTPKVLTADIDAIQATFRGGLQEPLHSWYPYLEGYSPRFVERVLQHYAPNARCILEPFAGVGTTPLTAAGMGLKTFYCELNPLLQYLIETKIGILSLSRREREVVADRLLEVCAELPARLKSTERDFDIHCSYYETFGKSRFFDNDVFEDVLRARGVIDVLHCSDPRVARLLEWAVLASLLPCSRLIRRGDVRFKNENELRKPREEFIPSVQQRMSQMILDIQAVQSISEIPECLSFNARKVGAIPSVEADALVTSPPYLNGTNYFRNTKVELWFMRVLHTDRDLRAFRDAAVTAGINDVSLKQETRFRTSAIEALVRKIESDTYDSRIPKMVADYFEDMGQIFEAINHHLKRGARVAVDIGDSRYNGVHVPTDVLLADLLGDIGYDALDSVELRRRSSRNGDPLRQMLLVFEKRRAARVRERLGGGYGRWGTKWESFKSELPHQQQPYAKRNWGHARHSICSYQGKLKPSLAYFLVDTFLPRHGRILDPFAGVGTIPFEAALRGGQSWSFDISPAALAISRAKLTSADREGCLNVIEELQSAIQDRSESKTEFAKAAQIKFNKPLPDYFHGNTLGEILVARRFFRERHVKTNAEAMVFACLLHILHGNRPYALSRRSHPITPFAPTGPTEYRPLIPRLREKVERTLAADLPDEFCPGTVFDQDVTEWWPAEVDSLDAIITSPPFFDSTRFYLANWMRLWFCGWEADDFKIRPKAYIDERQKHTFDVYKPFFRQARERLKGEGVLVLHLGKSRKCNMSEYLKLVARRWFGTADLFEESVEHCESHGIADKGTVKSHQFLILQ